MEYAAREEVKWGPRCRCRMWCREKKHGVGKAQLQELRKLEAFVKAYRKPLLRRQM